MEFISAAFSVFVSINSVELLHGGIDRLGQQRLECLSISQSFGQGKEADQGNAVLLLKLGDGRGRHAAHHREGFAREAFLQAATLHVF